MNVTYNLSKEQIVALEKLGIRSAGIEEPQHNSLQNLFDGAPVIVKDHSDRLWKTRAYKRKKECNRNFTVYAHGFDSADYHNSEYYDELKLPTIEESPRNTWLAHSGEDKCPEGAEELNIMVWPKNSNIPYPDTSFGIEWQSWENVERFMILEK